MNWKERVVLGIQIATGLTLMWAIGYLIVSAILE